MRTNKRERLVIAGLYDLLNQYSGLYPNNPANTERIFANARFVDNTASLAMAVLSHLMYGETDLAEEYLLDLKRKRLEFIKKRNNHE